MSLEDQALRSRHLDIAAVAGLRTAADGNRAEIPGYGVRPNHDFAAIARVEGVGADACVGTDVSRTRVVNQGIDAVQIAADQYRAAAGGAGCSDDDIIDEPDLVAENLHRAALTRGPGGFDAPRHQRGAPRIDRDLPAGGAVGGDHGSLVDGDVARGLEHDLAVGPDFGTGRVDRAAVADQPAVDSDVLTDQRSDVERLIVRRRDFDLNVGIARIDQVRRLARGKNDVAVRGRDDPAVLYRRRHQVNPPAARRVDRTLIDDARGTRHRREIIASCCKIPVRQIERGGDQPADVDLRAFAEGDSAWVDQVDAAIRSERPQDGRRIAADDAVEHRAGCCLLDEAGDLIRRNIETLPIDDRARRIGDCQRIADRVECRAAADGRAAAGIRLDRGGKARGNGEGQCAGPPGIALQSLPGWFHRASRSKNCRMARANTRGQTNAECKLFHNRSGKSRRTSVKLDRS